ncbi:MAG TPA: hypothetical protein VK557_03645 [Pyrinomonadaceae bacterium]|nr:hypothetical protein [Pyrinomonadaceae bacterium]
MKKPAEPANASGTAELASNSHSCGWMSLAEPKMIIMNRDQIPQATSAVTKDTKTSSFQRIETNR